MSKKFELTETVHICASTYLISFDGDETLADPTSVVITVKDEDGVSKVTAQGMTKNTTGKYEYFYTTTAGDSAGTYTIEIVSTSGTYVSIQTGAFEVVGKI